ncbi:hypothetical protein [Kitasatospora azatica]|uniref:hypothetical protein n=1 Tax=Kitasatospora azatica TaxID=58347 RepID=UPI00056636E3|nr:hypothetical protein [Kitasatospora azatica]
MRTAARCILTAAAALTLATLATATSATATSATATSASAAANPAPDKQGHTYSIPVGAISDLGDLTKVANLGPDFAALLGR